MIPYFDKTSNRWRRYFPDFEVITKDKKLLIEVKPKKETAPPVKRSRVTKRFIQEALTYGKNECKWEAAKEWCKKNGYEFHIFTEDQIFGPGVK